MSERLDLDAISHTARGGYGRRRVGPQHAVLWAEREPARRAALGYMVQLVEEAK